MIMNKRAAAVLLGIAAIAPFCRAVRSVGGWRWHHCDDCRRSPYDRVFVEDQNIELKVANEIGKKYATTSGVDVRGTSFTASSCSTARFRTRKSATTSAPSPPRSRTCATSRTRSRSTADHGQGEGHG